MKKLKIGILVSSSISGGNNVIFEHICHMHNRGNIEVCLLLPEKTTDEDFQWFPEVIKITKYTYEEAAQMFFNVIIASFWKSCYELSKFNADHYMYFNQSVESRFYDANATNLISYAEATYLLGLKTITEAHWIKKYIEEKYGGVVPVVLNGINKENYAVNGDCWEKPQKGKLRVLIEGNLDYKFKNVAKTIELCRQSNADEIWLLTSSEIESYPGVNKVFSKIPIQETQNIYRSCDVLVKLSTIEGMFGPPLEMFHCGGTAITYNVTGHDEYMINDFNGYVIDMHNETEVIEKINLLKNNPSILERLKTNAITTASNWYNWEKASLLFENTILESIKTEKTSKERLKKKIDLLTHWYNYTSNLEKNHHQSQKKIGLRIHNKVSKLKKTIFKSS